jgi:ABC-type polysaccharide/polyol phosphate transport system ATPase subunit
MSAPAIAAQGLGKKYRLGTHIGGYGRLTESIHDAVRRPFQRLRHGPRPQNGELWALRDVSLEIADGEVLGIVGRNGAGKTTLLKILARITEPTEGRAELRGRVGSLLEVGTGFHPELTGRENVYLNGAILGMRRAEIRRKFDAIVSFAELERFVDTPVKRYSSGMYVRLAFAVAAHLEPDILIVDEVLSVGDVEFQRRSLGKMDEAARSGRTVLVVSHQLNTIRKLCERCVWIDSGRIRAIGPTGEVLAAYESSFRDPSTALSRSGAGALGARFLDWQIVEPRADEPNWLATLGEVTLIFRVDVDRPLRNAVHGISLRDREDRLIWAWAAYRVRLEPGVNELVYTLPSLPVRPGVYRWQVSLYEDDVLLDLFECVPELVVATSPLGHPRDEWAGVLNIPCDFRINGPE